LPTRRILPNERHNRLVYLPTLYLCYRQQLRLLRVPYGNVFRRGVNRGGLLLLPLPRAFSHSNFSAHLIADARAVAFADTTKRCSDNDTHAKSKPDTNYATQPGKFIPSVHKAAF
jgi:hypothetical protein